jgi:lipid-A-disaccharide synthase
LSKKIFIITGESSGDKIASLVINKIKKKITNVSFLAIGGSNIKSENISTIRSTKIVVTFYFLSLRCLKDSL